MLHSFKKLHRTSLKVFDGDDYVLGAARTKINEEFKKNKNLSNSSTIAEVIDLKIYN